MKQKVSVRAIVRRENQTLLLRRVAGRSAIVGKFELPGGKIAFNEQPEEAVVRCLQRDTGLEPQALQLFDVVSYVDEDDTEVQHVFIVYLATVSDVKITLSDNYNKYIWQSKSKIQHREITAASRVLLGLGEQAVGVDESGETHITIDVNKTLNERYIIYSDGGSRGNPGISAAAYAIESPEGDLLECEGVYLGITTSDQAEYHGLKIGLERALAIGCKAIEYRLDSLMVVNQMKGIYQVKNRQLWPVYEYILDLVSQFDSVQFVHVRREFNTIADKELNRILDMHEATQKEVL
ncbi:MAG: reverse transcriptase-like protein [Candidatus Saccharibacteria bacterium]|nr:reverse transcriptase-like protein [Candidatus Saccharibacteria bacterium]